MFTGTARTGAVAGADALEVLCAGWGSSKQVCEGSALLPRDGRVSQRNRPGSAWSTVDGPRR
jgi:hypothetical protein